MPCANPAILRLEHYCLEVIACAKHYAKQAVGSVIELALLVAILEQDSYSMQVSRILDNPVDVEQQ